MQACGARFDGGDRMSQLNPDDIADLTVLRGSDTAALQRWSGRNGVDSWSPTKSVVREGPAEKSISALVWPLRNILLKPDTAIPNAGSVGGAKESQSTDPGSYPSNYVDDCFQTGLNQIDSISCVVVVRPEPKLGSRFTVVSARGIIRWMPATGSTVATFQSSPREMLNWPIDHLVQARNPDQRVGENRPATGCYPQSALGTSLLPPRPWLVGDYKGRCCSIIGRMPGCNRPELVRDWPPPVNPYWFAARQPRTDKPWTGWVGDCQPGLQDLAISWASPARGDCDYADKLQEQKFTSGGNACTTTCTATARAHQR